jgi:hypothetical protein
MTVLGRAKSVCVRLLLCTWQHVCSTMRPGGFAGFRQIRQVISVYVDQAGASRCHIGNSRCRVVCEGAGAGVTAALIWSVALHHTSCS